MVEGIGEEFRARYLTHVSETLDELEQFGIDVRRYKPRTLVSVAYLSLQVSTDSRRRGRGDLPDERWFIDGRRTVTGGSSSLRAEAALAESPRTLLRGDAGSGKTTLNHPGRSTADVVVSLLINVSWTGMSGRWWWGFCLTLDMPKLLRLLPRPRRIRGVHCSLS